MKIDKDRYLLEIESRLGKLFRASKEGYKSPDSERHRLEGFINAGVFLGITSNQEVSAIMARVHQSVFGVSIEQRNQQQSATWPESGIDYDYYDIPTFER